MKRTGLLATLALFSLAAQAAPQAGVAFDWFEYTGDDEAFREPLPPGSYRNPILAGFYPDPSITRAGDRYYLVTSTFAFFPGIPVFESRDLVHWQLIGHVLDRPAQLDFDGLGISRGVFAPTIEFHQGTFYVLNTAVDAGGNFLVTAQNPAGPWSEPLWLPIDGIDPSIFFDADGTAYILNNGPPPGTPRYDGHRAIWIQQFDLAQRKLVGPRRVLVDGGIDPASQPIWIEGPHLFRRGEWYYLSCAEGGTGPNHSQVILRGRSPWGPFQPASVNPILTQRDLPQDRPAPITNAGHADLIEAADGTWWATFLASRTYDRIHYNTGRETFLLPVQWQDDWPVILAQGKAIPYVVKGPDFLERDATTHGLTGNFTWRDEFDAGTLDRAWVYVRVPKVRWADLQARAGWLTIHPLAEPLDSLRNPSFLARRQQHIRFEASTAFETPAHSGIAAGMAAFQSGNHWYFFGARRNGSAVQLFLERKAGGAPRVVARTEIEASPRLLLKIAGRGRAYSFFYDDGQGWRALRENDDGSILSTEVAGGFVGAVLGPYARLE